MKYFFDTEFIEDGKTIDLISIGIVAEDGREYYAVSREFNPTKASEWVRGNVLIHLPPKDLNLLNPSISPRLKKESLVWKKKAQIASEVATFCGCIADYRTTVIPHKNLALRILGRTKNITEETIFVPDGSELKPEFWAYYADYDWIVFCQLFGTMMDLPAGFPMYCRDLKQEADRLGIDLSKEVPQENEHHALADARWNKSAYEYLALQSGDL